ncbi:MAG: hypothetical protein WC820_01535 [Spirochaetales bacterium]
MVRGLIGDRGLDDTKEESGSVDRILYVDPNPSIGGAEFPQDGGIVLQVA